MPIVRMPDGTQVRFPDDMPREQIRDLIASKFPEATQQPQAQTTPNAGAGNEDLWVPGTDFTPTEGGANWNDPRYVAGQAAEAISGNIRAGGQGVVESIPVLGPLTERAGEASGAAFRSMMGGVPFDQALEENRQTREQLLEGYEPARTAGNVAGSIGPFIGAGMVPVGQRLMGMTGPLLQRMGMSGASGAAIAGADTAARGGSIEDIRNSTLLGGGIGAAIPGLGAGISAAGRGVAQAVGPMIGVATDATEAAAKRIGSAFRRDQQSGVPMLNQADEAAASLNNQPVLNIDRGGETTRALARAAANQNPEARAIMERTIQDRFNTQGARTRQFFNRIMDGNVDDLVRTAQIQSQARAVNDPAYRAAFEAPEAQRVWNRGLQNLMQSDAVQRAISDATKRGSNKAALGGFLRVTNPFRQGRDGRWRIVQNAKGDLLAPNLAFWNQVKINLDDMSNAASRSGDKALAGDVQALSRELRKNLDSLVPAYANARSGAMGFFNAQDAVEAGRNAWSRPKQIDESLAAFRQLSPADREDFGIGLVSQIMDDVRTVNNRSNLMRFFDTDARKALLQEALGASRAGQLEAFIRVEDIMDRARGAFGNSTTARQLAEMGLAGGVAGGGTMAMGGDWQSGLTAAMLASAGQRGFSALNKRANEQILQRVAQMLASGDRAELDRLISNAMLSQGHMQALEAIQRGLGSVARGSAAMALN